ncbi:hypothetical protein D1AOALGA4SA_9140 [Olavius algarvensis Delta 1 endosymbiont]|nr:hypothetical protein D1AOALGA4SA_9140 [Olavius algarvensis Delta 1 endosymbiont]
MISVSRLLGLKQWKFRAGSTISNIIVQENIIFMGSHDNHVRAFNIETGEVIWDFEAGDTIDTPIVTDHYAWVGSKDNLLRAFDISKLNYFPKMNMINWGSSDQFWSYIIWGKAGLAFSKISEGYPLKELLKQCEIKRSDLSSMICSLAKGKNYYSSESLSVDPIKLRNYNPKKGYSVTGSVTLI